MKVINLSESNSILNNFMSELRDVNVQQERMRFRQNIVRIGHIEAYEISKFLSYEGRTVQTPLAECPVNVCSDDVVVGTVFRAGLPLHQSFLDIFDKAGNAFVSAYRYYKDREMNEVGIKVEYCASPCLDGKTLILVDPMLATGGSLELAYEALKTKGTPRRLVMACVIASQSGVKALKKIFPDDDVVLVCGAIDPVLNEHKYIVPGLGDAGDLMYGDKI